MHVCIVSLDATRIKGTDRHHYSSSTRGERRSQTKVTKHHRAEDCLDRNVKSQWSIVYTRLMSILCVQKRKKLISEHPDIDGKGMVEKRFALSGSSSVSDFVPTLSILCQRGAIIVALSRLTSIGRQSCMLKMPLCNPPLIVGIPVVGPTLGTIHEPYCSWIDQECSRIRAVMNKSYSWIRAIWAISWENQMNARKLNFEIFPWKCSPLASLELPEIGTEKPFEAAKIWPFEVTQYIGSV